MERIQNVQCRFEETAMMASLSKDASLWCIFGCQLTRDSCCHPLLWRSKLESRSSRHNRSSSSVKKHGNRSQKNRLHFLRRNGPGGIVCQVHLQAPSPLKFWKWKSFDRNGNPQNLMSLRLCPGAKQGGAVQFWGIGQYSNFHFNKVKVTFDLVPSKIIRVFRI